MKAKRRFFLAGLAVGCLVITLGVLFQKRSDAPPPRVQFLGFAHASNGWPTARFSVTNDAAMLQMVILAGEWDDAGIVRPAMRGNKQVEARFIHPPLPAGGGTNVSIPVPSTNVVWFVEVASAPEHSAMEGIAQSISGFMRSIGINVYWGLKPLRRNGERVIVPKHAEDRGN